MQNSKVSFPGVASFAVLEQLLRCSTSVSTHRGLKKGQGLAQLGVIIAMVEFLSHVSLSQLHHTGCSRCSPSFAGFHQCAVRNNRLTMKHLGTNSWCDIFFWLRIWYRLVFMYHSVVVLCSFQLFLFHVTSVGYSPFQNWQKSLFYALF